MATRSIKLRRRRGQRGRPRDEDAPRTASGRKSRARRPTEDPRAVAVEARRRVFGLDDAVVGHEKAATVLGRMWLCGDITESLREAGERYLSIHSEAMRALKAPVGLAVSGGAGAAGDRVSEDYVAWAIRAVARYEVFKAALESVGASSVIHAVVVEDTQPSHASRAVLIHGLKILERKMGVA